MNTVQAIETDLAHLVEQQHQINQLTHKMGLLSEHIYIPGSHGDRSFELSQVQVLTKTGGRVEIWLADGQKFKSDTTLDLTQLEKALKPHQSFIRTHDSFIVNFNHLDYFEPSLTEHKGRSISLRHTHFKAPLSAKKVPIIKKYYSATTLVHIRPWNERYQAIIDENLREFDKEIRFMSPKELKTHFKYQTVNDFNTREFLANIIWEYYLLLQLGQRDPIDGNIRTFWYYLKPTLSKAVKINSQSQYPIMIDVFKTLVIQHQLFKYKDFGFIDEGQNFYRLGQTHPNIILISEKTGHFKKLERLQQEFGITIVATGGMSSILTTEYLTDELEKVLVPDPASASLLRPLRGVEGSIPNPIHLITLVDYNPSGAIIAKTFHNQLQHEGLENIISFQHILTPAVFTEDEIKHVTDQIPLKTKADKTKARKWIAAGGGVNGQPLGIETEALILDFARLRERFKLALDSCLVPTPIPPSKRKSIQRANIKTQYNPLRMDIPTSWGIGESSNEKTDYIEVSRRLYENQTVEEVFERAKTNWRG